MQAVQIYILKYFAFTKYQDQQEEASVKEEIIEIYILVELEGLYENTNFLLVLSCAFPPWWKLRTTALNI